MTREDLLNDNVDLINRAGQLLAELPVRSLQVQVEDGASGQADVTVATEGISRLDVYVNGRPSRSLDVQDGQAAFSVPQPVARPTILEIQGFENAQLVARYRVEV